MQPEGYRRPHFVILTATDKHYPIIVDAVLLPTNSENLCVCLSLIQKHMFT